MTQDSPSNNGLVVSFLELRISIGILGTLLPFILAFGKMIVDGGGLEASLSAYYFTVMRNVFVGTLCAIGVLLWSYKGYDSRDNIAAGIGGVSAIGTAFFPAALQSAPTSTEAAIGVMHYLFAASYFLALAYFSLVLFRKSDPNRTPTRRKLQRNKIYLTCGLIILGSLVSMAVIAVLPNDALIKNLGPLFWLESLAIVAFGISWLTKGEAFLQDQP
jgi:hypothetical protein